MLNFLQAVITRRIVSSGSWHAGDGSPYLRLEHQAWDQGRSPPLTTDPHWYLCDFVHQEQLRQGRHKAFRDVLGKGNVLSQTLQLLTTCTIQCKEEKELTPLTDVSQSEVVLNSAQPPSFSAVLQGQILVVLPCWDSLSLQSTDCYCTQ